MKLLITLFVVLPLALFTIAIPTQAQSLCNDYTTSNPIYINDTFELNFENLRINNGQALIINYQGKPLATIDCPAAGQLYCYDANNSPGIFLELSSDGFVADAINTLEVTFINGTGVNDTYCTIGIPAVSLTSDFCAPASLVTIDPPTGTENTSFIFSGCAGTGDTGKPCDGKSRILLTETSSSTSPTSVTIPINTTSVGNSCSPEGVFEVSRANIPGDKVYDAQLYLGTEPFGNVLTLTVESEGSSQSDTCSFTRACNADIDIVGTQICVGTQDEDSSICADFNCGSCFYCGDGVCQEQELTQLCRDCDISNNPGYKYDLCPQVGENFVRRCANCQKSGGVWTALGCILTEQAAIVQALVRAAISISGGIALLLIIFGSFTIATAASNPKRVDLGKQIITAAIIGLVFILISSVILQLLGVQILQIPGL